MKIEMNTKVSVNISSTSVDLEVKEEEGATNLIRRAATAESDTVYSWRGYVTFECSSANAIDWAKHSLSMQLIGPDVIDVTIYDCTVRTPLLHRNKTV